MDNAIVFKLKNILSIFEENGATTSRILDLCSEIKTPSMQCRNTHEILLKLKENSSDNLDLTDGKPFVCFNRNGEEIYALKKSFARSCNPDTALCWCCGETKSSWKLLSSNPAQHLLKSTLPLVSCENCYRKAIIGAEHPFNVGIASLPMPCDNLINPRDHKQAFNMFAQAYSDLVCFKGEDQFEILESEWNQADPFGYGVLDENQWRIVVKKSISGEMGDEQCAPDSIAQGMALFHLMDFEGSGRVSFLNFLFLEALEELDGGKHKSELQSRLATYMSNDINSLPSPSFPKCRIPLS
eukprot:TRINITY_DN9180_c0_g1_i1.p1 TRINITY_DN9180_c0_g1~~TRINITY_DN9180_c0_g1_i1.p1  ORF type:complete len:298 (-),score=61.43 TRINITY_DN9180_c0_g1_i1:204-1097(-)